MHMGMTSLTGVFAVGVAMTAFSLPVIALAQDTAETNVASGKAPQGDSSNADIVVTGSRLREESVQETPVAVSVVNNQAIQDLHGSDVAQLTAIVPNLQIYPAPANPGVPLIYMRGFGVFGSDVAVEPGVAVYVDGIYQSTLQGALTDLFDLDKIEVLRGPQSTLLGKNASAGAILVTRSRPTGDYQAKLNFEVGSFNLVQAQALVNLPVVQDVVALKVFASARHKDGYGRNLTTGGRMGGDESYTLRGALLITPTHDINIYASADFIYSNPKQAANRNITPATGLPCREFGLCTPDTNLVRVSRSNFVDDIVNKSRNYVLNADWTFGGGKLTSITGYHTYNVVNNNDLDASSKVIFEVHDQTFDIKEFSQELRLSSADHGGWDMDGRLAWLIAGYYNHSNAFQQNPYQTYAPNAAAPGTGSISISNQSQRIIRETKAVFGHLDFDVTDTLSLSLGMRQSWDSIRHDFSLRVPTAGPTGLPYTQSQDFKNTSFEGGAQYKFGASKMLYFRYAQGYRGGGFIGLPGSLAQSGFGFGDETSESYEVGLKSEWFNRALLFNVALYSTNYDDLQRSTITPGPTPNSFVTVTDNIASARTRGFEVESVLKPAPGLSIAANLGYVDPKYLDYVANGVDLSKTPFPFVTDWTASVTPAYEADLGDGLLGFRKMKLQSTISYQSKAFISPNADPALVQPGFTTADAQVSLSTDNSNPLRLTFYVKNLTNKAFSTFGTGIGAGAGQTVLYIVDAPGREFGVSLTGSF
jgi:iron complex outermembrane receptor protein